MQIRYSLLFLGVAALLCAEPAVDTAKIQKAFGRVPLHFEPVAGSSAFGARGQGYSFQLTAQEARLQVNGSAVRMHLVGANPAATIAAVDPLPGRVNYLIGKDPSQWRRDVPTFSRVKVTGVYPGVDLVYYGNQKQLEYDLVLAPGADPKPLAMEFEGIESLRVAEDGTLILKTKEGEIRWRRPEVYQEKGGKRVAVASEYEIRGAKRVGFTLGAHDATAALTIDPILEYSTVLGGDGSSDIAYAIQVDSLGQAYVVGTTNLPDFPLQNGLPGGHQGGNDVFITKLNAAGNAVIFSTYLGGSSDEFGRAVALDGANPPNIFVAGETLSTDFPVVGGPQSTLGGNWDAFIAKLSANGNQILYSSYHGGDGYDRANGVGVHLATGTAYIAGETQSTNFPLINALQAAKGSSSEGFVAKYSAAGNARLFSTYLGGNSNDTFYAAAVDAAGNVYVAGQTFSTNYPTTNPFQSAKAGDWDCMITALNANGSARIYSTYLGGLGYDACFGIALDNTNSVYVTGATRSGNFPTINAENNGTFSSGQAAFVSKLSPQGSQLVYSTYIGSVAHLRGNAIAVDTAGRAHIAGETRGGFIYYPGNVVSRLPHSGPITPVYLSGSDGGFLSAESGNSGGLVLETSIRVLAYQSSNSVWAGSGASSSLYRSADNGFAWTSVPGTGLTGTIRALAFAGSSMVWVGTSDNVFFSLNNGSTWVSRTTGLPIRPVVGDVAVSPADPNLLLLHTGSAPGLYRSTNGGVTWAATAAGFTNCCLGTILFNPANPSEVLLGRAGGIMRSVDAGVTWTAFGPGLSGSTVTHIVRHPATPSLLFAIDGGALTISTDSGVSWTRKYTLPVPNARRIAVSPVNAQVLLINTTGSGVWRSANQGETWERVSRGDAAVGWDVVFQPSQANTAVMSVDVRPDGFAARLNADGSYVEYFTNIGTADYEAAFGVATDASGNSYVVGRTDGTGFPTTVGAVQRKARPIDAFVVKISPDANPPCSYTVTPPLFTLFPSTGPQGSTFGVVAPVGCPWTATSSVPWLTILAGENSAGAGEVRFAVAYNVGSANRSATVTVAGTPFTIQQSGTSCVVNVSLANTVDTATTAGGTINTTLTIPAGCPWTARSSGSWITLPTTSGTGNASVPIVIAPNPGVTSRISRVNIGPRSFDVTQPGSCTDTFTPNRVTLDALAAPSRQVSLNIGTGCPWTLFVPSFVTLTSPSTGTGPATVTYSVAANPDPVSRSQSIFGREGFHTITQNAATCTYAFPTGPRNLSAVAADGSFFVTTEAACVRAAVSNQPWLTLTGDTVAGSGNVFFAAAANTGTAARSATISLGGQSITVNQAGIPAATPVVFTPSPASGSALTQVFTFNFADANGATDLNVINVLVNNALDGRNACYVAYVRPANTVFLVPDNGDGLLPGVVPGVAGSASNSQCTINGLGSSVSSSGNSLTLTLNITFTAPFAGNKVIYQAARDVAGNNSGWTSLGVWKVPSSAVTAPNVPSVTSMTPARWAGDRNTFSFVFTDPNGFADLNVLNILVNSALDGRNSCYLAYVRPTNTLYLVPDNGDGLIAPGIFPDGGAGVTENSQCRILAQGSSVATSGNNLTLTLTMEFKTAAGRDRLFYLAARDVAGNNSGWQVVGSVSAQ